MELQIIRDRCDGAQMSVAKMAGDLTEERRACEVASRSTEIFWIEVVDLHPQLDARSDASFSVITRRHLAFEAGGVRAWSGIVQLLLLGASRCG